MDGKEEGRIFVGGLSWQTDERKLQEAFDRFGKVVDAQVREYIVDTEDYINIQLDNQRNQLIQFHLILIIVSFGIAMNTLIAASFGMNLPHNGDRNTTVGPF